MASTRESNHELVSSWNVSSPEPFAFNRCKKMPPNARQFRTGVAQLIVRQRIMHIEPKLLRSRLHDLGADGEIRWR